MICVYRKPPRECACMVRMCMQKRALPAKCARTGMAKKAAQPNSRVVMLSWIPLPGQNGRKQKRATEMLSEAAAVEKAGDSDHALSLYERGAALMQDAIKGEKAPEKKAELRELAQKALEHAEYGAPPGLARVLRAAFRRLDEATHAAERARRATGAESF